MMVDNIFKKIIDRLIAANIAYEDDQCLAFHDIHPQAPVHVLIIPKKVIRTHDELQAADTELLGHMHLVAIKQFLRHEDLAARGVGRNRAQAGCDGVGDTRRLGGGCERDVIAGAEDARSRRNQR